jgi:hypothetical protein
MPIVFAQPVSGTVTIRARGMISTQVLPGTRTAQVLPLSPAASSLHVDGLAGGAVELPLHAMDESERLIGIVGGSESAALLQPLFPGMTITTIRLDSPAENLDSLDAVLIDPDRKDAEVASAKGVVVAIRGQRPSWDAPLEHIGDFWVIKPNVCGPTTAIGGDDAYLPTLAWQHGWPAEMRRRIVLAGVLVSLAGLATLLIRRPRTQIILMTIVAVTCSVCIETWRRNSSTVQTATGTIRVLDREGIVQTDQWEYFWGGRTGAHVAFRDREPILFDLAHAQSVGLALTCDPQGLEWSATLPANATLATLRRTFAVETSSVALSSSSSSPMRELARRAYLRPGLEIEGEEMAGTGWSTIIIAPQR